MRWFKSSLRRSFCPICAVPLFWPYVIRSAKMDSILLSPGIAYYCTFLYIFAYKSDVESWNLQEDSIPRQLHSVAEQVLLCLRVHSLSEEALATYPYPPPLQADFRWPTRGSVRHTTAILLLLDRVSGSLIYTGGGRRVANMHRQGSETRETLRKLSGHRPVIRLPLSKLPFITSKEP